MNTVMTRRYVYFTIIFTIARYHNFILKNTRFDRKLNLDTQMDSKKQIWVEKPSNGRPAPDADGKSLDSCAQPITLGSCATQRE